MPRKQNQRRVCFVTGTRAEFGLMRSTLEAIREHPKLQLQLIATGSHLSAKHGRTIDAIAAGGWNINASIPWKISESVAETVNAIETGKAMAKMAEAFEKFDSEVILVVGDRVEAFAAAAAGHISGRIVAHIHGGDRALGQVDDALRHSITKLAHIHLPATTGSADRLKKLGEQSWRIHRVGSPGLDGITKAAQPWSTIHRAMPMLRKRQYALLVFHPTENDEKAEYARAVHLLKTVRSIGFEHIVIIYPNNDPGCGGIIRCWENQCDPAREIVRRDVERSLFLGLMRDAAVLVGNSSSGIIEAASFGTPVIDIEPRQHGRERSDNVLTLPFNPAKLANELNRVRNHGRPIRYSHSNIYGGGAVGRRIAQVLANVRIDARLSRKLIAF